MSTLPHILAWYDGGRTSDGKQSSALRTETELEASGNACHAD